MDSASLRKMPRKALQRLAKNNGIKANLKSEDIIQLLLKKQPSVASPQPPTPRSTEPQPLVAASPQPPTPPPTEPHQIQQEQPELEHENVESNLPPPTLGPGPSLQAEPRRVQTPLASAPNPFVLPSFQSLVSTLPPNSLDPGPSHRSSNVQNIFDVSSASRAPDPWSKPRTPVFTPPGTANYIESDPQNVLPVPLSERPPPFPMSVHNVEEDDSLIGPAFTQPGSDFEEQPWTPSTVPSGRRPRLSAQSPARPANPTSISPRSTPSDSPRHSSPQPYEPQSPRYVFSSPPFVPISPLLPDFPAPVPALRPAVFRSRSPVFQPPTQPAINVSRPTFPPYPPPIPTLGVFHLIPPPPPVLRAPPPPQPEPVPVYYRPSTPKTDAEARLAARNNPAPVLAAAVAPPLPPPPAPHPDDHLTEELMEPACDEVLYRMVTKIAATAKNVESRWRVLQPLVDHFDKPQDDFRKLLRQERATYLRMRQFLGFSNIMLSPEWEEEDIWDEACPLRVDENGNSMEVETDDEEEIERRESNLRRQPTEIIMYKYAEQCLDEDTDQDLAGIVPSIARAFAQLHEGPPQMYRPLPQTPKRRREDEYDGRAAKRTRTPAPNAFFTKEGERQ